MHRLAGGKGAVSLGLYRHLADAGHVDIAERFRSQMLEPPLAYQGTLELLQRAPNLVGIYMVGGGVEGVMGALREAGAADRIAAICHDLTDNTREGLIDGVLNLVLHQPREAMAAAAVRSLCESVQALGGSGDGRTSQEALDEVSTLDAMPAQIVVPILLYTAENI